jgi:hypothetical protein
LALTHQPLKMEAWLVRNFYVRQTQDHKWKRQRKTHTLLCWGSQLQQEFP